MDILSTDVMLISKQQNCAVFMFCIYYCVLLKGKYPNVWGL